jgi:sporulation protein YlmC with PRC-barrel domain
MNTFLSTTALGLALALPTIGFAQSTTSANDPQVQTENEAMQGFLSGRKQSDIFASELMRQDVYARRTATDMTAPQDGANQNNEARQGVVSLTPEDLEQMDNIGQINEIVLSHDGAVRALVIGAGGFLGMGEQDIAVTMDQVTIAYDQDDSSRMYVLVNASTEMLERSPRYDRTALQDDEMTPAENQRTALNRPEIAREGYSPVEVTEISSALLVGQSVFDTSEDSVGTVDDLIMDEAGKVTNVIIDFGGFLGMGSSQVSLSYDELTILTNAGNDDVRVYVDATKEQIQNLPQHRAVN